MKEKQREQPDRHLDTPSEANRDNHINFVKVEEESANRIADVHPTSSERQKQWREGLEEGKEERENSGGNETEKRVASEDDDTLGNQ
jgi:hypothetical protein